MLKGEEDIVKSSPRASPRENDLTFRLFLKFRIKEK